MTASELMFLYVVEEMNFTRAAEKHYVSQQAVSGHIRKLEEELGTKLFVRSPRLKLTDAGTILYASLRRIQKIEHRTREIIADDSSLVHARLTLGIHADRAHILFPFVFPAFHSMYPNVVISLVNGHTKEFVEMLIDGRIDLMIGHDAEVREDIERETIFEEMIYLMATPAFLEKHLPAWKDTQDSIRPEDIPLLPMTCTSFGCAVMDHLNTFFIQEHVRPVYLCAVVDYQTQLELCSAGHTAFFCPESYFVQKEFQEAMYREGPDRVTAVPVRGMDSQIHVELLSTTDDFKPRYLKDFRKILIDTYRSQVIPSQRICRLIKPEK